MTSLIVGFFCACLSIVLVIYSIWLSVRGNMGTGLMAMAVGLSLLLSATIMLRSSRTRL